MKKLLTLIIFAMGFQSLYAQSVGIGTATPHANALLHIDLGASSTNGLLITGAFNSGTVPDLGSGSRMMFYPGKAALRAGRVTTTEWDNVNVGINSLATGYNTKASGNISTAMGNNATASGHYSFAAGHNTSASGEGSTALGYSTTANGLYSTALGRSSTAYGNHSTAMGYYSSVNGDFSTAMGYYSSAGGYSSTAMGYSSNASGIHSTAMGYNTEASGSYSTAIGKSTVANGSYSTAIGNNVSTNNHIGSLVIGDNSTNTVMNSATDNTFRARFDNGYRFYTSADLTTSCVLSGGSNAWSTTSDVRLKENFAEINGEDFLGKIKTLRLTSWNYKKQDPKTFRHYGPMAQDFYAAFGKDRYGTIGNDITINTADFDGVNLIAIQALEKRTSLQQEEIRAQQQLIMHMQQEIDALKARFLKPENAALKRTP